MADDVRPETPIEGATAVDPSLTQAARRPGVTVPERLETGPPGGPVHTAALAEVQLPDGGAGEELVYDLPNDVYNSTVRAAFRDRRRIKTAMWVDGRFEPFRLLNDHSDPSNTERLIGKPLDPADIALLNDLGMPTEVAKIVQDGTVFAFIEAWDDDLRGRARTQGLEPSDDALHSHYSTSSDRLYFDAGFLAPALREDAEAQLTWRRHLFRNGRTQQLVRSQHLSPEDARAEVTALEEYRDSLEAQWRASSGREELVIADNSPPRIYFEPDGREKVVGGLGLVGPLWEEDDHVQKYVAQQQQLFRELVHEQIEGAAQGARHADIERRCREIMGKFIFIDPTHFHVTLGALGLGPEFLRITDDDPRVRHAKERLTHLTAYRRQAVLEVGAVNVWAATLGSELIPRTARDLRRLTHLQASFGVLMRFPQFHFHVTWAWVNATLTQQDMETLRPVLDEMRRYARAAHHPPYVLRKLVLASMETIGGTQREHAIAYFMTPTEYESAVAHGHALLARRLGVPEQDLLTKERTEKLGALLGAFPSLPLQNIDALFVAIANERSCLDAVQRLLDSEDFLTVGSVGGSVNGLPVRILEVGAVHNRPGLLNSIVKVIARSGGNMLYARLAPESEPRQERPAVTMTFVVQRNAEGTAARVGEAIRRIPDVAEVEEREAAGGAGEHRTVRWLTVTGMHDRPGALYQVTLALWTENRRIMIERFLLTPGGLLMRLLVPEEIETSALEAHMRHTLSPGGRGRIRVRLTDVLDAAPGIEEALTAPHAPWQNAFVE